VLARHQARRSCLRVGKGEPAAAGPHEGGGNTRRRFRVVEVDLQRPFPIVIPIDQHQPLTVLQTEIGDRLVRQAGQDDRGIGTVADRLPEREIDAAIRPSVLISIATLPEFCSCCVSSRSSAER
jgi:hypothetical protein